MRRDRVKEEHVAGLGSLFGLPGKIHAPEFIQDLDWINTARPLTLSDLRGKIVTAVSLRRRLRIPVDDMQNSLAIGIEHKGENFALIVDEVGDVLTLDSSMKVQIPAHFDPARSRLMAGLYKVGNLLIPALNIGALFDFTS